MKSNFLARTLWPAAIAINLLLYQSIDSMAGIFGDAIGAYTAHKDGSCNILLGFQDVQIDGVCIPWQVILDEKKKRFIPLAIAELKHPEKVQLEMQALAQEQTKFDVYRVTVDHVDNSTVVLDDGSLLHQNSRGHPIHIIRGQSAVMFMQEETKWVMCTGSEETDIEVVHQEQHDFGGDHLHLTLEEYRSQPECR